MGRLRPGLGDRPVSPTLELVTLDGGPWVGSSGLCRQPPPTERPRSCADPLRHLPGARTTPCRFGLHLVPPGRPWDPRARPAPTDSPDAGGDPGVDPGARPEGPLDGGPDEPRPSPDLPAQLGKTSKIPGPGRAVDLPGDEGPEAPGPPVHEGPARRGDPPVRVPPGEGRRPEDDGPAQEVADHPRRLRLRQPGEADPRRGRGPPVRERRPGRSSVRGEDRRRPGRSAPGRNAIPKTGVRGGHDISRGRRPDGGAIREPRDSLGRLRHGTDQGGLERAG